MDNIHLFELLNAGPDLAPAKLLLALLVAKWLVAAIPVGLGCLWVTGAAATRRELVEMLLAVVLALAVALLVTWLWPQPRPQALHLGTQHIEQSDDPGLPSDQVTVFWSLALSALFTRRFAPWGLPLLAVGLAVGWSRVFLGVHFPYDVAAALPIALAGALAARALRGRIRPAIDRLLDYDDRLRSALRHWWDGRRRQ